MTPTAQDDDVGVVHRRAPLPFTLSRFIGRQAELAELVGLVGEQRLVTITGAGGCGKTRLAAETLAAIADDWPDGIGWIDVAAVTDPARVADVAAEAMGVLIGSRRSARQALIGQLQDRHMVVGIDNCEHLLNACGELVETLLHSCPGVWVLATSREPLGITGETLWRVPSMSDREVMELFTDRATAIKQDFATDASNEDAVRTLCRRLDAIPLAVELAAAWVRVLTPAQIAVALDDRFRLLVDGSNRKLARHQTLAASVEWSYNLLRDDARTLLRRLAVFSGGFTLESATAVCAGGTLDVDGVLPALRSLVSASMCQVDNHDSATSRFRLLETIREYADRRLSDADETEATRDDHLDHYLAIAESAAASLEHGDQDAVFGALERDHDNLRVGLERGLSSPDPEAGRRLAAALARLWYSRAHAHEGIRWLQRAIDLSPHDETRLQAELYSGLSLVAIPGGRFDLVEDASRRAIAIGIAIGDDRTLALAYATSAYLDFFVDLASAQQTAQRAKHHAAIVGEVFAADLAGTLEAYTLSNRGRHDEAVQIARPIYERAIRRNDRLCASFARGVEIWDAAHRGDPRLAVTIGIHAVEISRPLNDYYTFGTNIVNLAWVHGVAGNVREGQRLLASVLRTLNDAGPDVEVLFPDLWAGWLHLWSSDLERALTSFERAVQYGAPHVDNWIVGRALPGLAAVLRSLGRADDAVAAAERGIALARRLEDPHSLAESLEELGCSMAANDPARAEDLHHEALRVRVEYGLRTYYADTLESLAALYVRRGRVAEGTRLFAAADAARDRMGYPRPPLDQGEYRRVVDSAAKSLGEEFANVWLAGSQLSLDDAVAYASRSRGPRQRPPTGWGSLTPTELEVVALVAEGLTNPTIAERLFISRDTVKTHLSHIYTKVGVATRTELAVLAARRQPGEDE